MELTNNIGHAGARAQDGEFDRRIAHRMFDGRRDRPGCRKVQCGLGGDGTAITPVDADHLVPAILEMPPWPVTRMRQRQRISLQLIRGVQSQLVGINRNSGVRFRVPVLS